VQIPSLPIQINTNQVKGQGSTQDSGRVLFAGTPVGGTVQAEVVGISDGKVTLKTNDGNTITAEFPAGLEVMPGDLLELTLTERGGGEMRLRLSMLNGQTVNLETGEMEIRLMDIGVEPSKVNTKIAEYLADRGLQPTAGRINHMARIIAQFPELPAAVALFMTENNVPISEQNIATLLGWFNNPEFMLGDKTQELTAILNQVLSEANQTAQTPQAVFTDTFLSALNKAQTPLPEVIGNNSGALAELAGQLAGASESEARVMIAEFVRGFDLPPEARVAAAEQLLTAFRTGNLAVQENAGQTLTENTGQPVQAAPAGQEGTQVAQQQNPGQPAVNTQEQPAQQIQQPEQTAQQPQQTAQTPTGQGVQTEAQQPAPPSAQIVASNVQGEAAIQQAPVTAATGEGQASSPVQNTEAHQPSGYRGELANQLRQVIGEIGKFTVPIKRDVPVDAQALQDALRAQQGLADGIKSSTARLMGEGSAAAQRAGDISSQVQLGNQLENFYYCQIPYEIAQNKNTAELYVFERRGKGEAGERTNTTVLIALDTEHLGRVETVLRANEETVLRLELRVETEWVQSFLSEEVEELDALLREEDFRVEGIEVVLMKQPVTPMNAQQMLGEATENFSLQAIDISI
jgi:hypothetical protein